MSDRNLRAELDAMETALTTPWRELTPDQQQLIRSNPLLEVAGKTLNRAATWDALRRWVA